MTAWSVGVVVPAHDEEDRIKGCLDALHTAVGRVQGGVDRVDVVVIADRCHDATAPIASDRLQGWGEVVAVDAGSAGAARGLGVRRILRRHQGPLDRLWLASTDADTVVPPSWLQRQLAFADQGVAGVAGIVTVDSFADHPPHVSRRWKSMYDGPADAPHPHVHGANLGLRADAHLAVGGWSVLEHGEDQQIWAALRDAGYQVASPRSIVVTTSGRARSRVRGGFADVLNVLAAS